MVQADVRSTAHTAADLAVALAQAPNAKQEKLTASMNAYVDGILQGLRIALGDDEKKEDTV